MIQFVGEVCTITSGLTAVFRHKIYTRHEVPIKHRLYRLCPAKLTVLNEQLKIMLANGFVEPSFSGWAGLFSFYVMPFGLKNIPAFPEGKELSCVPG